MASFEFHFLNHDTERVGADRIEYDDVARVFQAVCDGEGTVYIAPAANVRSIRKDPPIGGEASVELYLNDEQIKASIDAALHKGRPTIQGMLGL
ncbi:hypothetical protein [Streptomyces bangladeshensis]|uniref:Uncharacterized protein n=1 Tax=Streptomyces bangladeshensis TaxID=295352 RepID=A0ABN3BBU2_9ACTN